MRSRTVDLKPVAPSSRAMSAPADGRWRPVRCQLAFVPGERVAAGWYRAKIACPGGGLRRVGVAALGAGETSIGSFETSVPGRFSAYVHLGPQVASVQFRLEIADARAGEGMTATLRRIGLAEFIWHALRRGLPRRPMTLLRYFYSPVDSFIVTLAFPTPPRFADENEKYDWWIANREAAACRDVIGRAAVTECPRISILLTVSDPRPDNLRQAIDSVLSQSSPQWELSIADDASVNPDIRARSRGCRKAGRAHSGSPSRPTRRCFGGVEYGFGASFFAIRHRPRCPRYPGAVCHRGRRRSFLRTDHRRDFSIRTKTGSMPVGGDCSRISSRISPANCSIQATTSAA